MTKNANLEDIVDFAVKLVCEFKNSAQVLKFSKLLQEKKGELELVLKTYLLCLEDLIKIKSEKEDIITMKTYLPMLKSVESEFSVHAVCEIHDIVCHFMEKLQFNANISVAVDNLLLKILEVKYLCK